MCTVAFFSLFENILKPIMAGYVLPVVHRYLREGFGIDIGIRLEN